MTAAGTIGRALGGRRSGSTWIARCPAHDDREPSLSFRDAEGGKVLVHCFAGCDQERVIAALRSRGLWPEGRQHGLTHPAPRALSDDRPDRDAAAYSSIAHAIWNGAVPARGTLAEAYLASRRLTLPPAARVRFVPGLRHPSGGRWPAMIALVTHGSDDAPLAIHRTFLAPDGRGKAPVSASKLMLGPCRGGAVRLAEASEVLMVGEGIETCLAAMQAAGHPTWAALSISGLRTLQLPPEVQHVIVLADGDDPGEAAARDCAWRWKCEGRRVRIARPPKGFDFNDLLLGRVPPAQESTP